MKVCIIKSGSGYFVRFVLNSPEMTSDIKHASRFSMTTAKRTRRALKKQGIKGEIIPVEKVK